MCRPNNEYATFCAKGHAKGWSDSRIQRAWDAYQNQIAREDARVLNAAPAPIPIAVGDTVRRLDRTYFQAAKVLAIHAPWAWIEDRSDSGVIVGLCELERAPA